MENPHKFCSLDTERLKLRALKITDNKQVAAIRSDPEVNRYLARQLCLNIYEAEAFIKKIEAGVKNGDSYYWAICLKDENILVGTICLWHIDQENAQAELGYELFPALQGKGIMSEALEKVIGFAFGTLQLKKMVAITHRNNERSTRLLKKFGFVESKIPDEENDLTPDEIQLALINP